MAPGARAKCVDEDRLEGSDNKPAAAAAEPRTDPRGELRTLVREALDRSKAIGAARLLAEAAHQDTEEARAGKSVQAAANAGLGPAVSRSAGVTETSALQLRGGLTLSQLLYDGGRTDRIIDWRAQLAESARYGQLNAQEQLALNTVSLALERSRWRMQAQVYGQFVRKMGCLVEALETIVRADRGRASELVQVRKSLQQAEISLAQSQSQLRQAEVRLRRFVGETLPGSEGLTSLLLQVDPLPQLVAEVERASETVLRAICSCALSWPWRADSAICVRQSVSRSTRPPS